MPYLIHTGLELPLLLQGRKKLAFMHFYSSHPDSMVLKARFDHYVAEGRIYADEECYSMTDPSGGQITAYSNQYTPMGEEWRIPARALINRSSAFTKGWTEIHERLEGMLMGYEDWQNDWWLNHLAQSGAGLYGMSFRCAVTKAGMLWLEHAGFRALPPIDGEKFTLYSSDWFDEDAARISLEENPHIEAFVQFNIAGKHLLDIIDLRSAGPFQVPTSMIPEINSKLARDISIVLRREY